MRRILVVCYGNIYRSAFVGVGLAQAGLEGVEVRSAGFHSKPGRTAPQRIVNAGRIHGVHLDTHRSSVTQPSDVEWADTIVLMDRHNWQALMQMNADASKFVWLGTLDGGAVEIPDPETLDDVSLQRTVGRLADCTRRLAVAIEAGSAARKA